MRFVRLINAMLKAVIIIVKMYLHQNMPHESFHIMSAPVKCKVFAS